MIKQLFILLFFVCSLQSFSQKLVYKSNGNILNSENQKISPNQVRELLANNEKLLADYNAGRTKKTVGNVLIIGGSALIVADFITALTATYDFQNGSSKGFPTAISYVGVAALIIAIPVKIGFSNKIEKVVTDYNNQLTTGYNNPKLDLITNSNGIGLRLTLN